MEWSTPMTINQLRRFLSLARYYKKFIAKRGQIASLLTQFLIKEGFN